MIFGLDLTFDFNGKRKTAKRVKVKDDFYIINGTKKYTRIPLQDIDLLGLNFKKNKKVFWQNKKPLSSGKYVIRYNNIKYYVTYLDELELFKQVVLQE